MTFGQSDRPEGRYFSDAIWGQCGAVILFLRTVPRPGREPGPGPWMPRTREHGDGPRNTIRRAGKKNGEAVALPIEK